MKKISVKIDKIKVGELFFEKDKNQYGFNYLENYKPISLIMPYKNSSYIWKYKLHPIFDMNMPEGYLFELFKNFLTKEYGYIDDFLVFSYICPNIQSRLTFENELKEDEFFSFDLDEVLQNDTQDTFFKIVTTFLNKNAISGVQPKSLAILKDKESLVSKEYIIKTWADEYPQLALNEYFCLRAIEKSGVKIPNIKLSKNSAPAYDIVNTLVYFPKDRPALTMFGKKVWFGKKELVRFGVQNCYLKENEANEIYEICIKALGNSIFELETYIKTDKNFEDIGTKMLEIWKLSLNQKAYKEIKIETI